MISRTGIRTILTSAALVVLLLGRFAWAEEPARVDFNRDIRPILSENCFACHGPDKGKRKADLRLDTREGLFTPKEGVFAVVPGKPGESELLRRVHSEDREEQMPPPSSAKSLSTKQKQILELWIAQGAEWKGHWSFLKPVKLPEPKVDRADFVRNPIDRFLLARMQSEGLEPAREADRRTLIRRVTFDLLGLPPTAAEVERFVNDDRPDAYERLVDRLLQSPHHGEKLAVAWFDLVRFADTIGYHSDNPREIWPYRDYVIKSFNDNLPFSTFTIEQIAGDLLPGATTAQKVASGYNRLLQTTEEGGAQPKEYTAKYAADRVRNASTVWLGQTMGCAECHDHKFDPITTRDFYRFAAFFADIREPIVGKREPGLPVPNPAQEDLIREFEREIGLKKDRLRAAIRSRSKAREAWESRHRDEIEWTVLDPEGYRVEGESSLRKEPGGVLLSYGKVAATGAYVISVTTPLEGITAIRLEALEDPDFPSGGPGTSLDGNFLLTEFKIQASKAGAAGDGSAVPILSALADFAEEGRGIEAAIDGQDHTGWSARPETGRPHVAVFEPVAPIGSGGGTKLTFRLEFKSRFPQSNLGKLRLSATTASDPLSRWVPPAVRSALSSPTEAGRDAIIEDFIAASSPLYQAERGEIEKIARQRLDFLDTLPASLVSASGPPRTTRILPRGNWMDDSGEIVEPGTPGFLPPLGVSGRRSNRLDLARWLVDPENPLTARVFVNRLWKLAFGQGISKTLDDLGSQGEWPVHPEVLDWLAVEFRDSGWDVRHVLRLIVTSGAYRQSAETTHEKHERDPYNRLLSHQTRFRLEAESVRDNALAISGLLAPEIGGPSVKPFQPAGYWDALNFPTRVWKADEVPSRHRRGLYTHWQRSFPHPSLIAFDAPSREECTAERTRSNIPQQALALLNDPTYVEAAHAFAERILSEGPGDRGGRIAWAFTSATGRSPSEAEQTVLADLLAKQEVEYQKDAAAARAFLAFGERPIPADRPVAELAAWTSLARVLLNLHETITRP